MPVHITPQRLEEASRLVRQYYAELCEKLLRRGLRPLPDIRLYVSPKIRRNYGYCAFRREDDRIVPIKVAIAWFAYRRGPSMWKDVVAHEAAHAYCMAYHQRADHSPAWRHIAQLLGCTGAVVGCQDEHQRQQAVQRADTLPTRLTSLSARDKAAVRQSLRWQFMRCKDDWKAIEATLRRFPQFEPRTVRAYLIEIAGLSLPRATQLALPF